MSTQVTDTPEAAVVTPAAATDTQPTGDQSTPTVDQSILADLGVSSGGDTKQEDPGDESDHKEDDTAGVMMRNDYLRKMQALADREKALTEREKALGEPSKSTKEEEDKPQGDAGGAEWSPYKGAFAESDVEKMEFDSPMEKQLVQSLKASDSEIANLQVAFRSLAALVVPVLEERQTAATQQYETALEAGTKLVSDEYGVAPSREDLSAAMKIHGNRLYEKSGKINGELIRDAWIAENIDAIRKAKTKNNDAPAGQPKPPPMGGAGGTPHPVAKVSSTDEQILADLGW